MFGKPEWFTYRSAGWGLAPRTWQGWVYCLVATVLFVGVPLLPLPGNVRVALVAVLGGAMLLDVFVIMAQLGRVHDERERLHQLIIERNCSFSAVTALCLALLYQSYQFVRHPGPGLPFDPLLLAVLGIMALTKFASTLYLRWKR